MEEDRFLKKQIQTLNRHLPKRRFPLADLHEREKPRIDTRNGKTHRFKKKELHYLFELLPKDLHGRLLLPIIIRISPQFGRGAARISGKTECFVVEKILEKETKDKDEIIIHRPEVRILRKKLPTATQYAFELSSPLISSKTRSKMIL